MDSGNSGSMQSSSGGDEEYDSRPESISAFLMNSSGHHLTSSMSNPRAAPPHPGAASHTQFDPLSNYMDAAFPPRSPQPSTVNSLLNLENMPPWARASLRSDPPNCTDIGGGGVMLLGSSSSALSSAPAAARGAGNYHHAPASSAQLPPPPPMSSCGDQPPPQAGATAAGRSSKKRSRASRRAPTTVLTTDTSNFRAMVQEFTGIPAPPFSASSFPRTRLDLFGSAASSALRSAGLADAAQPPPYLLRPFAHKLQPSSSPAAAAAAMLDVLSNSNTTSTTLVTTTAANGNAAAATTSTTTNSPSSNFQHQNLLNMNNNNNNHPIFTFQSLLQSPKYPPPLSNLPVFNNSKQSGSSSLKMGMMEDFAGNVASGSHLSALMADGGLPTTRTEHNWVDGGAGHGEADRNFGGNYDASSNQRVGHCKLNYAGGSSTEFQLHAEKGTENVITSRGEGMVDSWICSSD